MRNRRYIGNRVIAATLSMAVMIMTCACGSNQNENEKTAQSQTEDQLVMTENGSETDSQNQNEIIDLSMYEVEYTDRDTNTDWQAEEATCIIGSGNTVEIQGEGIEDTKQTLTIQKEGTYVFSGNFEQYAIVVNAPESRIRIVLNGMEIQNENVAPVTIVDSKKVVITLADCTQNTVSDQRETDVDQSEADTDALIANAAIYSKEDITFQGNGSLKVISKQNNGITCKDKLLFMGGNYEIEADGHGVTGKDCLVVHDGTFQIVSGKDGLRSANTEEGTGFIKIENGQFTIDASQDGIQAESLLYIEDGEFTITSGGGNENGVTHKEDKFGFGGRPHMREADEEEADRPPMPDGEEGQTFPMGEEFAPPQFSEHPQENFREPPQMKQDDTQQEAEDTVSCKGIKAGKTVYVKNGNFLVNSADDSIHANENVYIMNPVITIQTGDDGIHADDLLEIYNGSIDIQKSYEGLEAANISVYNGIISIVASDDGMNVAGGADGSGFGPVDEDTFAEKQQYVLTIAGGSITIDATGDGLDSNGGIVQTGGTVIVDGPSDGGNGALDYDTSYLMNGGTLLALGNDRMLQTASDDSTCYGVTAYYSQNLEKGTRISVLCNGNELISHELKREANSIQYISSNLQEQDCISIQTDNDEKNAEITAINTLIQSDGTITTGEVSDSFGPKQRNIQK